MNQLHRHLVSSTSTQYTPAQGRYILFVSEACPWCHRCTIIHRAKRLESVIQIVTAFPVWNHKDYPNRPESEMAVEVVETEGSTSSGWNFEWCSSDEEVVPSWVDPSRRCQTIKNLYEHSAAQNAAKGWTREGGIVHSLRTYTLPLLFCRKTGTVVNNHSKDIALMLNNEFNEWAFDPTVDFFPYNTITRERGAEALRSLIDALEVQIEVSLLCRVYSIGFERSQVKYEAATAQLFNVLDQLESLLSRQRYLVLLPNSNHPQELPKKES